jgi:hypothetical protein
MPAWQGLWTDVAGVPAGHSLLVNKAPIRNRIKRVMNREAFRAITELFDSLIGATAGGAASATHERVGHPSTPIALGALGGSRDIEVVTDISRNTDAADVTALKEMVFNVKTAPASYVRDLSGNGSQG